MLPYHHSHPPNTHSQMFLPEKRIEDLCFNNEITWSASGQSKTFAMKKFYNTG